MVGRGPVLTRVAQPGRRTRLLAGCALVLAMLPALAHAQLVQGGAPQVSAGGQAPNVVTNGRVTDIGLGAARTVLDWSAFNLASDQTVVYRFEDRGWIVLNRISGQAVIDGQIEALVSGQRNAGNVWFSAPGGVIFGANARVNVGGLLATTGSIAQAGFLDPANLRFSISGTGVAGVQVRGGAELKSGGGALALISGAVTTEAGAKVTGSGTVLYGAANDVTVRFAPLQGDLDLVDFIVPAGSGTGSAAPLTLRGETVGGTVFLAAVNRADIASAVINASGLVAARSATADRGDIVLTAGVDIVNRQPGARTNGVTETTAAFGIVSAQRDLLGGFGAPTSLTVGQLSAGRDLGLSAAGLDAGAVNAGRLLLVDASRGITLRSTASSGGAATFRSLGALDIRPGAEIAANGRLQLDVGSVAGSRLTSGRSVVINASGVGANGGPAVNLGLVLAEDDILVTATNAAGSIVLGAATITGARADEAPTGRTLSLTARGAQGDVTYGVVTGGSAIDGATKVLFSAGRDVTANVSGLLTLAGGSAGRNFLVRAGDLDLTGPVTATNLRVESLGGGLLMGSRPTVSSVLAAPLAADAEPVMSISDAEFQQITVANEASFYAGSTLGVARGNLTVLDLHVNTARIPRLLLAAGGANDILVTGNLAPDTGGGVLTIGEADPASPWRPGRILVTGAIGYSTGSPASGFSDLRPFDEVNLNALRDVILGSPRFVSLVAATAPGDIDISGNRPTGVSPTADERDRIFLTSGSLSLSASERIVQQNTGTRGLPNGILITSQILSARALSVTPARVVDLFGAFRNGNGVLIGGFQPFIRSGGVSGPTIRFNGCDVADGGCAVSAISRRSMQIPDLDLIDPSTSDGLFTLPPEPPVLVAAEPDPDAIVTDPVTLGSGSDELWRQSKRERQPAGRSR